MANFLFLHAHPDDESIFTGGIIKKLSNAGHNVYVVFATGGELGVNIKDENLQELRLEESYKAARILGVKEIYSLGFHDSGLDETMFPENAFANCDINLALNLLSEIMDTNSIDALICDDEFGIYGHPDHVMSHRLGSLACEHYDCDLYYASVDREYLHFVDTHLVEEASEARKSFEDDNLRLARSTIGMSSVEITHTINCSDVLEHKRLAMKAHSSQISTESSAFNLSDLEFKAVYGFEWLIAQKSGKTNELLKKITL